jgi:hypothetical protein
MVWSSRRWCAGWCGSGTPDVVDFALEAVEVPLAQALDVLAAGTLRRLTRGPGDGHVQQPVQDELGDRPKYGISSSDNPAVGAAVALRRHEHGNELHAACRRRRAALDH